MITGGPVRSMMDIHDNLPKGMRRRSRLSNPSTARNIQAPDVKKTNFWVYRDHFSRGMLLVSTFRPGMWGPQANKRKNTPVPKTIHAVFRRSPKKAVDISNNEENPRNREKKYGICPSLVTWPSIPLLREKEILNGLGIQKACVNRGGW